MRKPVWSDEGRDWPNREASRFVRAGGIDWHVQIMGVGPAVLLLHGTGAATHSWSELAPLLARHFTVIAPDLPGHGFTGTLPRGQSLPGMASLVAALLTELAIAPALAIGHSAGAAVACRMALDRGITPTGIVSINGALQPFPGIAAKLFPAMARTLFLNPLTPRIFALQARGSSEVARFMLRSTGSRIDARGIELYRRLFARPGHVAGALGMMANWDLAALARDLPRLAVPVALLAGDRDIAIPASVAAAVAKLLPAADVVAMPGLGHLAHEEAPARVADLVLHFARAHAILPAPQESAA